MKTVFFPEITSSWWIDSEESQLAKRRHHEAWQDLILVESIALSQAIQTRISESTYHPSTGLPVMAGTRMTGRPTVKVRYTRNKSVHQQKTDLPVNRQVRSGRPYSDRHRYWSSKVLIGSISVFHFTRALAFLECHKYAIDSEILRNQICIWTRRLIIFHGLTHFRMQTISLISWNRESWFMNRILENWPLHLCLLPPESLIFHIHPS
jgi:hypothetical protein